MEKHSTETPDTILFEGTAWFDPIETGIRDRVRGFIEGLLEEELTAALGRGHTGARRRALAGYRHGSRKRTLTGSFGPVDLTVPRRRMAGRPRNGVALFCRATPG